MKWQTTAAECCGVAMCCLGVGFVSGKEAQQYLGSVGNLALFAAGFFCCTFCLRTFCQKHHCKTLQEFWQQLFDRGATAAHIAFCACGLVCGAGAVSCLRQSTLLLPQPLLAIAVAAAASLALQTGQVGLKVLNLACVALFAIFVAATLLCVGSNTLPTQVHVAMPVQYAAFCFAVCLGVCVPAASFRSSTFALWCTAILCAMQLCVMLVSDFSLDMPLVGRTDLPLLNWLGVCCFVLAAIVGIAASLQPVANALQRLLPDKTLCNLCVCTVAASLGMLGDNILQRGFDAVAMWGLAVACRAAFCLVADCLTRRKNFKLKNKNASQTGGVDLQWRSR